MGVEGFELCDMKSKTAFSFCFLYREIRHANVRRQAPQRGSGKSAFTRSSSGRSNNNSNFF